MTSRSVSVVISRRRFSYLIPPGENPKVGDWILVSIATKREAVHAVSRMMSYQIAAIEDPAHPKATKMYLAYFTTEFIEQRQAANIMRDAVVNGVKDEKLTSMELDHTSDALNYTVTGRSLSGRDFNVPVTRQKVDEILEKYRASNPDVFKFWSGGLDIESDFSEIEERVLAALPEKKSLIDQLAEKINSSNHVKRDKP